MMIMSIRVGVPVGALEKYTVLGGSNGGNILSLNQVTVQNAAGSQQQVLVKMRSKAPSVSALNLSVLELSRGAKAYSSLMKAVRPVLFRDASAARVLLGTKPLATLWRMESEAVASQQCCGP